MELAVYLREMDRFVTKSKRSRPLDLDLDEISIQNESSKSESSSCPAVSNNVISDKSSSSSIESSYASTSSTLRQDKKLVSEPIKKKRINYQTYRPEYTLKWSFIQPVENDTESVECTLCRSVVKINHGGQNDILKHLSVNKHKRAVELIESKEGMEAFLGKRKPKKKKDVDDMSTTNAESLFLKFLIEHNIPLSASDHSGELFAKMFPDSDIAKTYASKRTKSTCIMNSFGEELSDCLASICSSQPFSIATDGSNDSGSESLYPIVVRYFNEEKGEILTELLTLASCAERSTGENIFNILNQELTKRNISWDNCLSFGCDNANVMIGLNKGVAGFIHSVNSKVQIQGCPCHLLHIAAKNGSKKLSADIESILIDIYFYFDKSTKRQQEFISLCKETGEIVRKILKHGPTRWLSLNNCNSRLLELWDSLAVFFINFKESEATDRVKRLQFFFKNPLSKAYCLFLKATLPHFVNANTFLQREEPLLHIYQDKINDLLTDLAVSFITRSGIEKCSSLMSLKYADAKIHKKREDVIIGSATRKYLDELKSNKKITKEEETSFFKDVKAFFAVACTYISTKLPVEDSLLAHAGVLAPEKRANYKFNSIEALITAFPAVMRDDMDIDTLKKQFFKFQVDPLTTDILQMDRVDKAWAEIKKIKTCDGELKYNVLATFALGVPVVPHSNAGCERVFSMVRKCKTEFRSSMSTRVLSNLIIQKVHMQSRGQVCHEFNFTEEQLILAKGATSKATKHH